MDFIIEQISLFLAGFIANILASLSGGGAGFVQLPVLIFLGLSFPMALGTHKVAVVALGVGAFTRNPHITGINKQVALLMLLVGCPSVALGSVIIVNFSDWIAEVILGLITILNVIYSIYRKDFGVISNEHKLTGKELIIGALLIALVGLLSGSFSSGAGLFGIMTLVLWFKMDIKRAINHSMIFVALIWNFVGAFTIGSMGQIHWPWVPMLLTGAFIGGYTGTMIMHRLNVKIIKKLFQTVMIISGALLLIKGYQHAPESYKLLFNNLFSFFN